MITFLLWLNGLVFAGLGLACLYSPELVQQLTGYSFTSADAWIEARAMYGGLQLSIGLFSLIALLLKQYRGGAILLLLLVYSGLFFARLGGFYLADVDDVGNGTYIALGIEAIMSVVMLLAFMRGAPKFD